MLIYVIYVFPMPVSFRIQALFPRITQYTATYRIILAPDLFGDSCS